MTALAELSIVISEYDLSFVRDWGGQVNHCMDNMFISFD